MDRLLLDLLFDFAIVSGLSVAVLAVAVFAMPWAAILWDLNLNSKSDDLAAVAVEEGMIDLFISAAVTVEQYGKVKWNKNLQALFLSSFANIMPAILRILRIDEISSRLLSYRDTNRYHVDYVHYSNKGSTSDLGSFFDWLRFDRDRDFSGFKIAWATSTTSLNSTSGSFKIQVT